MLIATPSSQPITTGIKVKLKNHKLKRHNRNLQHIVVANPNDKIEKQKQNRE